MLEIVALVTKRLVSLESAFRDLSKQPGPKGDRGEPGTNGTNGVNGLDGKHGVNGLDGKHGVNGLDGKQGPKGDTGPAPDHEWRGTKLRFKKPDESWGKFVDLKGAPGSGGGTIVVGGGSGSGPSPDPAPTSPQFTYMGGKLVAVTYADGRVKTLDYMGDQLSSVEFDSVRKDFSYNPDGTLAAVAQSAI